MNRAFVAAATVIVVGLITTIAGQVLYLANSSDYWDNIAYHPYEQWANEAKQQELYMIITNLGTILMGFGLAVIAIGLARERPPQVQFREVPSKIPMQQYPQPPQTPPTNP